MCLEAKFGLQVRDHVCAGHQDPCFLFPLFDAHVLDFHLLLIDLAGPDHDADRDLVGLALAVLPLRLQFGVLFRQKFFIS